jgi:hypothetical protein
MTNKFRQLSKYYSSKNNDERKKHDKDLLRKD